MDDLKNAREVLSAYDALVDSLRAENARLRKALKPFAVEADCYSEDWPDNTVAKDFRHISIGDLRAAHAALNEAAIRGIV